MQKLSDSKAKAALRQKRYRERQKETLVGVAKNEEKLLEALLNIAETVIEALAKREEKTTEIISHLLELRKNNAFTDDRLYEALYRLQALNDVLQATHKPPAHYEDGILKLL